MTTGDNSGKDEGRKREVWEDNERRKTGIKKKEGMKDERVGGRQERKTS